MEVVSEGVLESFRKGSEDAFRFYYEMYYHALSVRNPDGEGGR